MKAERIWVADEIHRRRSSVNFGGRHFASKYMHEKLTKCPNFTWELTEKLTKFPNFAWYMAEQKLTKCPNFTWFLPEKYFFPIFWGRGQVPPLPSPRLLRLWMKTPIVNLNAVCFKRWRCGHCCQPDGKHQREPTQQQQQQQQVESTISLCAETIYDFPKCHAIVRPGKSFSEQ